MLNIIKIAARNLRRYKRRTMLTTTLVTLGVLAVLLFISVSGSFKAMMTGQITDSMLGHIQIHKKGYVASVDNLPLDRNLNEKQIGIIKKVLDAEEVVESYTMRIRLGAMFSNFAQTTNIRLNAYNPEQEARTMPLLAGRVLERKDRDTPLLEEGEILIPELLARGLRVKPGDVAVLVANNRDGSVNGRQFVVAGVLEGITGPGGRDGAIHLADARDLLRIEGVEVSEIAVRLKDIDDLPALYAKLERELGAFKNDQGKPLFEVHSWKQLTPFANIVKMIDLLTLFIKIMLITVVLVSVMNVMIMAVYERMGEIGTIAAIGTPPGRISSLFIWEGFLLGGLGSLLGTVLFAIALLVINNANITFDFGRQKDLLLQAGIDPAQVVFIVLLVIAVSVLASLQPAIKASRLDPIEALRHA
ncbi:MAG: ABC transporter permease [Desulfurivibrionaceae bacterium]